MSKYVRFLPVAQAFADMSKDTSTKVGAVVLSDERVVLSSGWNGAPRGCAADEDARFERPEKYWWACHAEMNVVAQAARHGVSLLGGTMVVTHAPCMICARLIVQAGIIRVVYPEPDKSFAARWAEDITRSTALFAECGVEVEMV